MAVSALLTTLLVACHSPQDNNEDGTKRLRVATNALKTLPPFEPGFVSLLPYVESADDPTSLELSDLKLIDAIENEDTGQCNLVEKQEVGFGLQIDSAVCEYQYTLMDRITGEHASGKLIVISSTDEPVLEPLASAQLINESVVIEITPEVGYELSSEFILYGDGKVEIKANEITYTGRSIGLDQILYSLVDTTGDTKIGQVNISVANTATTPIVAEKGTHVFSNKDDVIDVTPYVSGATDFSVTDVVSLTANVTLSPLDDKSITLKAAVGDHWVSYLVSDGKGAMDVGSLSVTIEPEHGIMSIYETSSFYITTPPTETEVGKFPPEVRWQRCSPVDPDDLQTAINPELHRLNTCLFMSAKTDYAAFCERLDMILPAPNGKKWDVEEKTIHEIDAVMTEVSLNLVDTFKESKQMDTGLEAFSPNGTTLEYRAGAKLEGMTEGWPGEGPIEYPRPPTEEPTWDMYVGLTSIGGAMLGGEGSFFRSWIAGVDHWQPNSYYYANDFIEDIHLHSTMKPICHVAK
ncbi:hypothetical protein GCM10007916_28620 [Psychromonas marina]|uniref:Uncharacterized protein n=2 Tax=Psychromonas marina TaxID=88364 RepID=A0ABQ6E2Y5_9GAMM|nr:hypothetical protein GCM10007916_28620 [Psychromonas marina]